MFAIGRELEAEQKTVEKGCARGANEQVPFILRAQSPSLDEPDACRSKRILPTELGIVVVRARQHVETCKRSRWGVGYEGRSPTQLLQITGAVG